MLISETGMFAGLVQRIVIPQFHLAMIVDYRGKPARMQALKPSKQNRRMLIPNQVQRSLMWQM
ncbi:MAG: hypothetical protein ACRD4L_04085 [Pyrinomonadaceae bacterium]